MSAPHSSSRWCTVAFARVHVFLGCLVSKPAASYVPAIGFFQMPFYWWVPVRLHTVMLTPAIACRALDERLRQSSLEPADEAPAWT